MTGPRYAPAALAVLALLLSPSAPGCKAGDGKLPISDTERAQMLEALDSVDGPQRATMAWAVLKEGGAKLYGVALSNAASGVASASPDQRSQLLVRHLLPALERIEGCEETLDKVAAAPPEARGDLLLAGCPTGGGLLAPERAKGADWAGVMAALVAEDVARDGGFAKDPLHLKIIAALLAPAR